MKPVSRKPDLLLALHYRPLGIKAVAAALPFVKVRRRPGYAG